MELCLTWRFCWEKKKTKTLVYGFIALTVRNQLYICNALLSSVAFRWLTKRGRLEASHSGSNSQNGQFFLLVNPETPVPCLLYSVEKLCAPTLLSSCDFSSSSHTVIKTKPWAVSPLTFWFQAQNLYQFIYSHFFYIWQYVWPLCFALSSDFDCPSFLDAKENKLPTI